MAETGSGGTEFDRLCVRLGLTTAEAARRLGVPWLTAYRWRTGRNRPSRLAQARIDALAETAEERT